MKILIVNAYVRENAGDAAILNVLVGQLRKTYHGSEIKVGSLEDPVACTTFEGAVNIGSTRRYVGVEDVLRIRRIARKILSVVIAKVWFKGPLTLYKSILNRLLPKEIKAELDAIAAADLVVFLGGGQLNAPDSLDGNFNIFYLTFPILLAERLGKTVIFCPQSYGPFGNERQNKLVRSALNKAALIMVREETSYKILTGLGIAPEKMLLTIDSGFAFRTAKKVDLRQKYQLKKTAKIVGITVRNWLSAGKQASLEKSIAQTIDYLHEKDYEVLLIPQVTANYRQDDDRIVEARIAQYCQPSHPPILMKEMADAHTLKAIYDDVDFLIGTRFHSVIFSLTSYVPCIAIEYDHKTSGIMSGLGLGEWVMKIADVKAQNLIKLFDKLEVEAENYRKILRLKIPAIIAEADATASVIYEVAAGAPKL